MARNLNLGIGLGIDFSRFDRDLQGIANKIEATGKAASERVANVAGGLATGQFDPGEIAGMVRNVGAQLATGIAGGVRRSSELLLGFTASIQRMLDRLVGAAVTIFRRIDSAMK